MTEFWHYLLAFGGVAVIAGGLGYMAGFYSGWESGDRRWR